MDNAIFLTALVAAGLMGFANQRGGTCTVAAIEEIVHKGRFKRLQAMLEAALWVAGGMIVLAALGWFPPSMGSYAVGLSTILGGILFGLGAFVNRACIFGTVARLGSGEWAYLATPIGFFFGSLAAHVMPAPIHLNENLMLRGGPAWLAVLTASIVAARLFSHVRGAARREAKVLQALWSPHLATTVIGLTFLVALVAAGAWTYSDVLSDAARGVSEDRLGKAFLNIALLAGAVLGGWTAGKLRFVMPNMSSIVRLFIGGTVMGIGGALIPGGNTELLLIGLPTLQPYAWIAFLTICVTIYLAVRLSRT